MSFFTSALTTPPGTTGLAERRRSIRRGAERFAKAALTPLGPEDALDLVAPLRAGADLRGKVISRTDETADSATILIKPSRDWEGHRPGQYVRVGVDVDGVRHWRTYSLTHGPRPDRCISITVKAIPDGTVSGHLVRTVRTGDYVQLGQADGEFVLPDPMPAKLLMITAGSGVTPVIGMLRNLSLGPDQAAAQTDIVVVHSAMRRDEVIFGAELRDYADRGLITLHELHTDTHGLLQVDPERAAFGDPVLEHLVPDVDDRLTFACGPVGLLDALEERYRAEGWDLCVERFLAPVIETGEGGEVTYAKSDVQIKVDGATSLLDAGEAEGVLMPSGCRMGVCFGCVLPLKSGAVRDLRNGAITRAGDSGDPQGLAIQTCINAAAGPCQLDI